MIRRVLLVLVVVLSALILIERGLSLLPSSPPARATIDTVAGPRPPRRKELVLPVSPPSQGPVVVITDAGGPPPVLDPLVRLAARRRLREVGDGQYLDSLLIQGGDSVIRHWPPEKTALTIAIITGGPPGYRPALADYVRQAIQAWDLGSIRLEMREAPDSAGADLVVRWIERFKIDRGGETELTSDRGGRILGAVISLALADSAGRTLPDEALRVIAVHEVGHALGLPHSADPNDVMYPSASALRISNRDRTTLSLLYELPLGSIKAGEN